MCATEIHCLFLLLPQQDKIFFLQPNNTAEKSRASGSGGCWEKKTPQKIGPIFFGKKGTGFGYKKTKVRVDK
jgi:hypothetical protein